MTLLFTKPKYAPFYKNICKICANNRYIFQASKMYIASTVDMEEVKKFSLTANEWWDNQRYGLLHTFNSVRVPFIRDGILSLSKSYEKTSDPLQGYHILDIGCGGGILSEPLARIGANVTGLDPVNQNIEVASEHAAKDPEIKERLSYICDTVENLATSDKEFDAVVASEVIEHVNDVKNFIHSCVKLTKANGSLFFTTINKTNLSYLLSILFAEYAINLVPKGTHDWNKFVRPDDLMQILESLNCRVISIEGIMYNPITKKFSWCKSSANWYALHAVKES